MKPRIVVVGSLNMDLVVRSERLPRPGETVVGLDFRQAPGGKGANQAVAAARLGAEVTMIGRVGADPFGQQLTRSLASHGIDTGLVEATPGTTSGLALIGVEASGQNAITIVSGANALLAPADLARHEAAIAAADALLVQLEVPLKTVAAAVEIAKSHRVWTILDPAPAPTTPLPEELLAVSVLSPNQSEAESLTGLAVNSASDAERSAAILHRLGAKTVVIKLGKQGALASDGAGGIATRVAAPQVAVVDATAAGDAFTAALTVAILEKRTLVEATQFACAAGSLATTRRGAQHAMPTREEVDRLLRQSGR